MTDTPGIRAAEAAGLAFEVMRTERPSSAEESAALQGIELGQLLRTIVIRRGADDYVFVLVPGGRQIDCPKLRRTSASSASLCRTPVRRKPRRATNAARSLPSARPTTGR